MEIVAQKEGYICVEGRAWKNTSRRCKERPFRSEKEQPRRQEVKQKNLLLLRLRKEASGKRTWMLCGCAYLGARTMSQAIAY